MEMLFEQTDVQTSAFITSSGGHRWTCIRIDLQAYIISVCFAFIAMFFTSKDISAEHLAMTAIGLQMTSEITRQFDMAIRWSVNMENFMVSIQRVLALAKLEPERNSPEYIKQQKRLQGLGSRDTTTTTT